MLAEGQKGKFNPKACFAFSIQKDECVGKQHEREEKLIDLGTIY